MQTPDLDQLDIAILACLQADARTIAETIGAKVGLSAAAVQRRIKRLREAGVIEREVAVLFGGLTPTGNTSTSVDDVNYLQQIYGLGGGAVKGYFDVLAAHPGSNNNTPDQLPPEFTFTGSLGSSVTLD